VTGADNLGGKTWTILRAVGEAGKPLKTSEIEDRTGIARQSIAKHIRWNMLYKWLKVEEERRQSNGHWIRYYGLTALGTVKLERIQ